MKRSLRLPIAAAALLAALPAASHAELLYGVTFDNQLITFDSAAPNNLLSGRYITGIGGADIVGIDFRRDGTLYGVTTSSQLITISTATAAATTVGALTTPLNGTNFGVSFDPSIDILRITSDIRQNLRVNADTAANSVDGAINYIDGTTTPPQVTGTAYTASGTAYGVDAFANTLVRFSNPNAGTITTVGALGLNSSGLQKMVISSSGTAYASIQPVGFSGSNLYTVNLTTGAATLINPIGPGGSVLNLRGLAAQPVPEPASFAILGLGALGLIRRKRK